MASEWPSLPLGSITENFDRIRVPVKERDRVRGPYPYYGASGVVDQVDDYLFDGTYLLIAEDGENLKTRQTPIAFIANGKFWVNNHAHIVRGNEKADTRFLMYALANTDITGYLSGSTMPKLTQGNMNRIPVVTPPLPAQLRIADILGTLDDKIELNQRMNRTLEKMAAAIFKSWFIDFDPVHTKAEGRNPGLPPEIADLFPDSFEDSELGPIPAGWRVTPIGNAVRCVGGATPSTKNPEFWKGGQHPFVTPKDMSSLNSPVIVDSERHITDAGVEKISSKQLPVGTVILSSRAPIGYLGIATVPVSVNQGVIAMICDADLPNLYVLHWTVANMDLIKSRAGGTTFAEISKRNFRPILALVPSKPVLDTFMKNITPLHKRITVNVHQNRRLAGLRDTLLPGLLSGEIELPEDKRMRNETTLKGVPNG